MTILGLILLTAAEATTQAPVGFWASIPAGAWTLAGAIVGSIGLKAFENWQNRHKDNRDDRAEFRAQISEMQQRLDKVEEEVTFWRSRFYEEQEDNAMLRVMMIENGITPPHKKVMPPSPTGE